VIREEAQVVYTECIQRTVAPAKLTSDISNSAIIHQSTLLVFGCAKTSRSIRLLVGTIIEPLSLEANIPEEKAHKNGRS
jgi:hypothetical protein